MTKAVRVHKVGGPEALVYEAIDLSQWKVKSLIAAGKYSDGLAWAK